MNVLPQIDAAALAAFQSYIDASPQDQPIAWQFLSGGRVTFQGGTPTQGALDRAKLIRPNR